MEKKKVNYKELNRAFCQVQNQVREASRKLPCGRVEIYNDTGSFDDFTVRLKINWSCRGSQNVEDTAAFAKVLNMAIELVNSFSYNGYEVEYKD